MKPEIGNVDARMLSVYSVSLGQVLEVWASENIGFQLWWGHTKLCPFAGGLHHFIAIKSVAGSPYLGLTRGSLDL